MEAKVWECKRRYNCKKFFFVMYLQRLKGTKEIFLLVFHSSRYLENLKTKICLLFKIIEKRRKKSNQNHISIIANSKRHNSYLFVLLPNWWKKKLVDKNGWMAEEWKIYVSYFIVSHYYKELKRLTIQIVALKFSRHQNK